MAPENDPDIEENKQTSRRQMAPDPRLVYRTQRTALQLISPLVGWVGVAMLLAALLWWAIVKLLIVWAIVLLVVGGAGVVFWVVANFAEVRKTAGRRQFQVGLNSTAFAIFALGILVLINFVVYRHHTVKDMTAARIHSLSQQSIETVKDLDKDVEFLVFIEPDVMASKGGQEVINRFREYERHSRHVKLQIYDPYVEPDLVKEYNVVTPYASQGLAPVSVVVKCGERHDTVTGSTEADLTNAILQVTTEEKPKLYFLSGNGEYPLEGNGTDDLSNLKRALEGQQYETETLVLGKMTKPEIPSDCKVLVIAGPTHPLPEAHMAAIKQYVDDNGKLLLALGCGLADIQGLQNAPDFHEILQSRDVTVQVGMVVDLLSHSTDKSIPAISKFEDHHIVSNLQLVALPTSCALRVAEPPPPEAYPGAPPPPAQKVKPLLKTSAQAWLETSTDPKEFGPRPDKLSGPLVLAVAIDEGTPPPTPPGMPGEAPPPQGPATRIVVFGDADFLTNRYNQGALWSNQDMAMKALAWLAARENLVSIPPKREIPRFLSMKHSQKWLATIVCLIVIPGLVIVSGVFVWFVRRRG